MKKWKLIVGKTCHNCKLAEKLLDEKGFQYEKVIGEDNLDYCRKLKVAGVPALIIDEEVKAITFQAISNFIEHLESKCED